jgi:hypothetical protein
MERYVDARASGSHDGAVLAMVVCEMIGYAFADATDHGFSCHSIAVIAGQRQS